MDIKTLSQEIKMKLDIPGAVVQVEEITSPREGIRITVTDKNGTKTGEIFDGEKGEQGEPGTTDYTDMTNKPTINGVTLEGDMIASDLDLATQSDLDGYETTGDAERAHEELTELVEEVRTDLQNYYTKTETDQRISAIPKFAIEVVSALPVTDISETTVYLLTDQSGTTPNLYIEYIYVHNHGWEQLGTQTVDLSGYYTKTETDAKIEAAKTLTNNDKKLMKARRQTSGDAVYLALIDEDNNYNNVYGLPGGAAAGAYLRTPAGTIAGAEWETPDTTPTAASTKLITSGAVKAYVDAQIQAQITDALNASY